MKFAINGNENNIKKITMHTVDGINLSPDIFSDMEPNFPSAHEYTPGSDAIICTEEEYAELVEWWEQYCEDANNHEVCDNGDDYTEANDNAPEFVLFVD